MNEKINAETAEILGAFIGDGWIEKNLNGIYITGDMTEDKEYYDKYLGPLFCQKFSEVKPRKFKYWGVYGISCYKRKVISKCIKLGFKPGKKALTVKIPSNIFNSKEKEIIIPLLRGIFDADGSFWCEKSRAKTSSEWKRKYHYHPEFQITSISKGLLDQIKILLNSLDIESKVTLRCKKGIVCNRNVNNCYGLRIRKKKEIEKWFKIIGSSNPRHQTRFLTWKKIGYLPPRTNLNQRKEILNGKLDPKSFYE
jgi:hypothetical protein